MEHIELNIFLKVKGIATSGGEAKHIIRSGAVLVDGVVETRNRRKLIAGSKVGYLGKTYEVTRSLVR